MVTARSLTSQKSAVTLGTRFGIPDVAMADADCMTHSPCRNGATGLFLGDDLHRVLEEFVGTLVIICVATFDPFLLQVSNGRLFRSAEIRGFLRGAKLIQHVFTGDRRRVGS